MRVGRVVGRTGVGISVSMQSARADSAPQEDNWFHVEQPRERELFGKRKSRPEICEPGSRRSSVSSSSFSQSPQISPSLSPSVSSEVRDSALLLQPLEKLVPQNMKLHSFLQKTWTCAEQMAKNPSIQQAIQGSSEFHEFREYMRTTISHQDFEQIEGQPNVSRSETPEPSSSEEGKSEHSDLEIISLLRNLVSVPFTVIHRALTYFFYPTERGEELEPGSTKPQTKDSDFGYTALLTACVMLILLFGKRFRRR